VPTLEFPEFSMAVVVLLPFAAVLLSFDNFMAKLVLLLNFPILQFYALSTVASKNQKWAAYPFIFGRKFAQGIDRAILGREIRAFGEEI
jgi:hypothetical protein